MDLPGRRSGQSENEDDERRVLNAAKANVAYLGDRIRDLKRWEKDYFARSIGPVR